MIDSLLVAVVATNLIILWYFGSMAIRLFRFSTQENGASFWMGAERAILLQLWLWDTAMRIRSMSYFGLETLDSAEVHFLIARVVLGAALAASLMLIHMCLKGAGA